MKASFLAGCTLSMILLLPTTGRANFGFLRSLNPFGTWCSPYTPTTSYYVTPPPVAIYPTWPRPMTAVAPSVACPSPEPPPTCPPPRLFAVPTPAPPSNTPDSTPTPPPGYERMPKAGVSVESKKVGSPVVDTYYSGLPSPGKKKGDCQVVFWNLSSQGLELTIEGRRHTLAVGQTLRLDMKREFQWGVRGHDAKQQVVPDEESGVEIVIRG